MAKANNQKAAETAYQIICDKILSGELGPGERLTRRDMAELTGVSIIPVIEALHRLENEGLVDSSPYIGSHVISVTAETKRDRYALRLAIEGQVARMLSNVRLRESIKRELYDHAIALDSKIQVQKYERMKSTWEYHYNFHYRLAELTQCSSLIENVRRNHLFILLEWQKLSYWDNEEKYKDMEAVSHIWLLKEILSGDTARAETAARRHIASNQALPEELIDWHPENSAAETELRGQR